MKKILIFISIFFIFTVNTLAYVDFTELNENSSGSYAFTDDFKDVKLLKNYVVWETDKELAIVTSDGDIYIYEHALTYYLGCKGDKCKDINVYKYAKNGKGQFVYQSKSDRYAIRYNMNTSMMQKVWSNTEKIAYNEIFTNLKTYYSNNPIKEKYTNFDMPKKELPTLYKNKLANKDRDFLAELGQGISDIFGGLGGWFNQLFGWLADILQSIKDIPSLIVNGILDGLKTLFIPSDEYFQNQFNGLKNKFNNVFNIDISFLNYSGAAKQINENDFTLTNEWGTYKLINLDYINSAFEKIRPLLRGFFGFLILLFNIDQFGKFIGVGGLSSMVTFVKGESKK